MPNPRATNRKRAMRRLRVSQLSDGEEPADPVPRSMSISSSANGRPYVDLPTPPCDVPQSLREPFASAEIPSISEILGISEKLGISEISSMFAACSFPPRAIAHGTLPPSQSYHSPSPLLAWTPPDWYLTFFIRIDHRGSFHTYPDVGGPFQSSHEADNAIIRYLNDRRDPKMCPEQSGVSPEEMVIRRCLYWPDGKRRRFTMSEAVEASRLQMGIVVQAILDQFNEDNEFLGDLAYKLKDVLQHFVFFEGPMYYHLNFTTKTEGADDVVSTFFAEVTFLKEGERQEMVVSCLCMIDPNDNGYCFGCINNGNYLVKHPNKTDAFTGGHLNRRMPFVRWLTDLDYDVEAEEARIRSMYEDRDEEARIVAELGLLADSPCAAAVHT